MSERAQYEQWRAPVGRMVDQPHVTTYCLPCGDLKILWKNEFCYQSFAVSSTVLEKII
jgi:hypothetical protein